MIALASSNLAAADYNSWTGTLTIEFHSGGIYAYYDVPRSTYDGLMQAESHGKYFHRHIKKNFRWSKIG